MDAEEVPEPLPDTVAVDVPLSVCVMDPVRVFVADSEDDGERDPDALADADAVSEPVAVPVDVSVVVCDAVVVELKLGVPAVLVSNGDGLIDWV